MSSSGSSSFGRWYEEKKNDDEGDSSSSTSNNNWFGGGISGLNALGIDDTLPLFNTDTISNNLQNFSYANMKASMEQQMPKKILGLNYQQRFQVCEN